MTTDARAVLRLADEARRNAAHARESAKLMAPGVRLGLSIGTFSVDNYGARADIRHVICKALTEYADDQEAVAADLESRVMVAEVSR